MKHTVQAIVVAGAVVGLISDPRLARTFQGERHPGATLVPLEVEYSRGDLEDAIETAAQEAADTAPAAAKLDPERERIKGEVLRERRERELRAEIEAELDEADEKPAARRGRR